MSIELLVTLSAAFVSVALVVGWGASAFLSAQSPERRRLRNLAPAGGPDLGLTSGSLVDEAINPRFRRLPGVVPRSPQQMNRLRRRLAMAGYTSPTAVVVYGAATILTPLVFGLIALSIFGAGKGLLAVILFAAVGYMLPGIVLAHLISKRKLRDAQFPDLVQGRSREVRRPDHWR